MERISLNGSWRFWPAEAPNKSCGRSYSLEVPGSWQETPGLEEYDGPGCYKRSFYAEPQPGTRAMLHFGGVYRRAEVVLNDTRVGEHNGFQSPFSFDVTEHIRSGENRLEVWVDSRKPADELLGTASVFEVEWTHLAGLYGPVTLEMGATEALTGLYTPIDLEKGEALFLFSARSSLGADAPARLQLELSLDGDTVSRTEHGITLPAGEGEVSLTLPLEKFLLWSPEAPVLYTVDAVLTAGGGTAHFHTRTGFKRFETRGTDFYLNGEPYYLLGYGDDFVHHDGIPSATDSGFYHHGILRAKEYGFNFARHHSHFPFEAYLNAADELGLLVQPELALANVPREAIEAKNTQLFLTQWRALIRAYRHHPCIAVWCGGNEMEWGYPFNGELYAEAKRLDPYRPVESTDGNFMACDVDDTFDFAGIVPSEYTDYLPYRELDAMFLRDHCGKPQVVHEMGNYTTVFAAQDLPRFEKAKIKSVRTEKLARLVQEKGLEARYAVAYKNALALQKLCHKLNIEKARLSPYFAGYHLWTLIDYYETTQGLLNSFYQDKAFTAAEFSTINSQCVLLWDTKSYTFRAKEPFSLDIKLSKYGSDVILDGTLTLTLSGGGQPEHVLLSENRCFGDHGLLDAVHLETVMPDAETEKEYTLTARFVYSGGELVNSWSLFAVPRVKLSRQKEIYIHYLSRHLFEDESVPVRHFTIPQPIGKEQLIVTGCLYGGMLEAVENGASMLLLAGADTFEKTVTRNSFKSPWWDPGEIWYLNHTNNIQTSCVVEQHPATAMLPYTGAWKLDLFGAVEQAPAVDIDALGLQVEPLIYGLGLSLERFAYLFQFALGKGKVLVSSFNHTRADMQDIGVEYTIKSLINYAMSDAFMPQERLTTQQFRSALCK